MNRFEPYAFALLRIITGLLFVCHGTSKLFDFPHDPRMPAHLPTIAIVAAVLELVLGLLITLGIFASYAAFIASGEMAAAYFMAHATKGFWPTTNDGEIAVLYCFIFLYIFAHGPGLWSVTKK